MKSSSGSLDCLSNILYYVPSIWGQTCGRSWLDCSNTINRPIENDSGLDQIADVEIYITETVHPNKFLFNNQPDALIIQIYSVTKLYMFQASSLPIIRSFLLYIRHW